MKSILLELLVLGILTLKLFGEPSLDSMREEIKTMNLEKSKLFDKLCDSKKLLFNSSISKENVESFQTSIIELIEFAKLRLTQTDTDQNSAIGRAEVVLDILAKIHIASSHLIIDPDFNSFVASERDIRESKFLNVQIENSLIYKNLLDSKKLIKENERAANRVSKSFLTIVALIDIIRNQLIEVRISNATEKSKIIEMMDVLGRLNLLSESLIQKPTLDEAAYAVEIAPILHD